MVPNDIKTNRLYDDLSYLMPMLCPVEGYEEEAQRWKKLLIEKLGGRGKKILELGVGGGCNLSYLTQDFEAEASDLSQKMLDLCHSLNPHIPLHLGDIRSIRLNKKFDGVLIHDAASYLLTEEDIRQTAAAAAAHLNRGGVFIISPDYFKETFEDPDTEISTFNDGKIEMTYFQYSYDPDPEDTLWRV